MQHLRTVAFVVVLAGVAILGLASFFNHLVYSVENKEGQLAVFSCKESSSGKCFLMVGTENGKQGRPITVESGKKVAIPVTAAEDTICYSVNPDLAWPACLRTEFRQSLKESIGTFKIYFRSA